MIEAFFCGTYTVAKCGVTVATKTITKIHMLATAAAATSFDELHQLVQLLRIQYK